jgi:hypothetical protein
VASIFVLTWELSLPGCRSLKQKRATVLSLKDRLRHKFKVSVAETDFQDLTDRAELTVALVASDGRLGESIADKLDRFVFEKGGAVVTSSRRERV